MTMCMAAVSRLKDGPLKQRLHYQVYTSCFQLLSGAISAVVTYHNPENKPTRGICVANHTSPIDVLVMACDNAYALVSHHLVKYEFSLIISLIHIGRGYLCSTNIIMYGTLVLCLSFVADWTETYWILRPVSGHVIKMRRSHLV